MNREASPSAPCGHARVRWGLLNIVSGTAAQTQAIVDLDAVPVLIRILLESSSADVQEQAVWAIGNIAGDSVPHRDLCLNQGAVDAVLKMLESSSKVSCIRTLAGPSIIFIALAITLEDSYIHYVL